jgi:hypothetical protein
VSDYIINSFDWKQIIDYHNITSTTTNSLPVTPAEGAHDDSQVRSTMGGFGNIIHKTSFNIVMGESLGKSMEDISASNIVDHIAVDHKVDSEIGENDSTVSTVDSHVLHSSSESSPQLSPLHGYHYLSRDDAPRTTPGSLFSRPNVMSTIEAPHPSMLSGTNTGSIVEMVPSGACSVSTAPSTADEASSIGMDSAVGYDYFRQRSDFGYVGTGGASIGNNQNQSHRRIPSWDLSPHQQAFSLSNPHSIAGTRSNQTSNMNITSVDNGFPPLPPQQLQLYNGSQTWASQTARVHHQPSLPQQHLQLPQQSHQRMSGFRGDQQLGYHPSSPGPRQPHQLPTQRQTPSQRYANGDSHLPFVSQGLARSGEGRVTYQRPNHNNMVNVQTNPTYSSQQSPPGRKPGTYSQQLLPPSSGPSNRPSNRETNSRIGRGRSDSIGSNNTATNSKPNLHNVVMSPRRAPSGVQQSAGLGQTTGTGQGSNSRSSSEVLKTLLRKKACLYEPDTSRAVALVTWLVGKELALEHGYFSRQQLQAGVHACVTSKIESGVITRTKVNRCMQIILNSCFHYIIPRPDGTEENGEVFREIFANEILKNSDPQNLLETLPVPWHDITINRDEILLASSSADDAIVLFKKEGETVTPSHSPRLGSLNEATSPGGKEFQVDGDYGGDAKRAVLLCFNENVRHAEDVFRCHNEFIRDTAHASHLQLSSNEWVVFFGKEAANAPNLWGNIGIPIPFAEGQGPAQTDALGVFNRKELAMFRTSWCSKRYDHSHDLCGFAHAEVNNGWLRRNPSDYAYADELCPHLSTVDKRHVAKHPYTINECPHGVACQHAHSVEEIVYHPNKYKKSKTCSFSGRVGGCPFGDICPNYHPADSYRFPKKSDTRSPRHTRHQSHSSNGTNKGFLSASNACVPCGSPILYASPAPFSSFEQQLVMPGLQNLFRRQCSVVRSSVKLGGNNSKCLYSLFGDDDGVAYMNETLGEHRSAPIHQSIQAIERAPGGAFMNVYKSEDNQCDHWATNSVG